MQTTPRQTSQNRSAAAAGYAPCCNVWPRIAPLLRWMVDCETGNRLSPHLYDGETRWRVHHCPACGKKITEIEMTLDELHSHTDQAHAGGA